MKKLITIALIILPLFLSAQNDSVISNIYKRAGYNELYSDSRYFDYVKYEFPVLLVSGNNMYEMFESIVISTINCEDDSKSFDIDKISYIVSVCNVNGYDMDVLYGVENKEDCFYVEAYEENDIINYIDNDEYYGVLSFNELYSI